MSYIQDHPTHFNWRPDVKAVVKRLQARWPWQTWIGTYLWHPPYDPPAITIRYDARSLDVWGGGIVNGVYRGKRGKPLPAELGKKIWDFLWNMPGKPDIYWIIYRGRMWVNPRYGGRGWGPSPPGPPDSDSGHWNHIHITYV